MPRHKVTQEARDFWQALEELLGERFSGIKALIIVKPKGNYIIVLISVKAVRLLGLGGRRRRFRGSSEVVIHGISKEMSAAA